VRNFNGESRKWMSDVHQQKTLFIENIFNHYGILQTALMFERVAGPG
jgi:hypothetical protein